ncbi:MAG: SPASM domain-containing protein [Planctomycetes bacterium]|nr:SPASM domain-containing protein [Planctomycetota bacterium]
MSVMVTRILFIDRITLCMLLVVGMGSLLFNSTNRVTADEKAATQAPQVAQLVLHPKVKQRCLQILRDGMRSDEFWPSIHAAEGLTLAGYGGEVRKHLQPKLKTETDDQKRCGLARELVRAGDKAPVAIMLDILAKDDPYEDREPCNKLWTTLSIDWHGDVSICCRDFDMTTKLGNIFTDPVESIWNGPEIRAVRRSMVQNDYASLPLCGPCPEWAWVNGVIKNREEWEED